MVKLQFDANEQFKITLPKSIVMAKKWKKGDTIEIELDARGDLVLRKRRHT